MRMPALFHCAGRCSECCGLTYRMQQQRFTSSPCKRPRGWRAQPGAPSFPPPSSLGGWRRQTDASLAFCFRHSGSDGEYLHDAGSRS